MPLVFSGSSNEGPGLVRVTDPVSNQVFGHLQLAMVTHTEAAKRVKAALLQFHLRENRVQRAAKHV